MCKSSIHDFPAQRGTHFCVIKITPKIHDITAYNNDNRALDHVVFSKEKREEFVRSGLLWEERTAGR